MTLGQIAGKSRSLTNTDTSSYTDSDLLVDINIWNSKVGSIIYDSQDSSDFDDQRRGSGGSAGVSGDYPMQTTPMIAGQRDYSFGINEKVLKYKRVDVSWDGGTTFYRAEPLDDGTITTGLGNDTQTDSQFTQQQPRYDVKYGAIWIYPLPTAVDVANGALIRAEWERSMVAFTTADYTSVLTDSAAVPGFDDPFHPILAYGAAFERAASKNLPQLATIQPALQDWEQRLRTAYGKKDLDIQLALTPAFDNAYGN